MELQKRMLKAFFPNVDMNQPRKLWTKTNCPLFFFFFEMFKYFFMELRSDKITRFLSQINFEKSGRCTRSKAKGVIKVTKVSATAKQRSITVLTI